MAGWRQKWLQCHLMLLTAALLGGCSTPVTSLSDRELEAAAAAGNGNAQYALAYRLAARQKYERAMTLMQQVGDRSFISGVAQETRSDAARQVGDWFNAGLGEPRSESQARQWWQKAAALGNGRASWQLAQLCQQRYRQYPDVNCIAAFETAAEQGNADAQLVMAQWYSAHDGSDEEALAWLKKAAEQDNAQAIWLLAGRYEQGKGVAQRSEKAERLYLHAATLGYPAAQRWMGEHRTGAESLAWLEKAAAGQDAAAMRGLARAFLEGKAVPHDKLQGLAWLKRAVEAGDAQAAWLYAQQQDDEAQREHYLTIAAQGNDYGAQRALAQLYAARGDAARARTLLVPLANQGDVQACYTLAEMQRLGLGGKVDFSLAFKYYRLAAQAGDRQAQYRMGMMRQEGYGAPRNRIHAYAWFSLATTQGMKEAMAALDDLEAAMTSEEIKAAQRLAKLWAARITQRQ